MSSHLEALATGGAQPDVLLTRPVFDDAYRKLQQKHDVWKKNYKPPTTLQALLCLLS